jgi:cbb3-type cytochrome oxidase maturation protein
MSIIFLILPVTLLLSVAAVVGFAWATRSGQFDDLETPAIRLLQGDSERSASARAQAPSEDTREPE